VRFTVDAAILGQVSRSTSVCCYRTDKHERTQTRNSVQPSEIIRQESNMTYFCASNISNPRILLEHVLVTKHSRVFNDMSVSFGCASCKVISATFFYVRMVCLSATEWKRREEIKKKIGVGRGKSGGCMYGCYVRLGLVQTGLPCVYNLTPS
jgi:hypothetical protein